MIIMGFIQAPAVCMICISSENFYLPLNDIIPVTCITHSNSTKELKNLENKLVIDHYGPGEI